MADEIDLFLCVNSAYLKFASVTLISASSKLRSGSRIRAHVLSMKPVPETMRQALQDSVPDAQISFIDASSAHLGKLTADFEKRSGIALTPTWLRVFISELFPTLERAIYLDCDLSVMGDLAVLEETDLQGFPIGAVKDPGIASWRRGRPSKSERRQYKSRDEYLIKTVGLADPAAYFNAGVLLFSPRMLHDEGFLGKAISWLSENPNLRYLDQDLLNHFFWNRCKSLDPRWNVLMGFTLENPAARGDPLFSEYFKSLRDPWCCHYAGNFKPWLGDDEEYALPWTQHVMQSRFCWQLEALRHQNELEMIEGSLRSSAMLKLSLSAKREIFKLLAAIGVRRKEFAERSRRLKKILAHLK